MGRQVVITTTATILACLAQPALAAPRDAQLGKVHFETSCTPAAQKLFDRAMLYQHSFWYRASQRTFEEVLKTDPNCAMAYWGIALSLLYNPHAPPPPANLPLGLDAVQKGKALGVKTEREREYIDAIGVMYMKGQGVKKVPDQGIRWLMRAARKRYAPAEAMLGDLHYDGIHVKQDKAKAVMWYTLARQTARPDAYPQIISRFGTLLDEVSDEERSSGEALAVQWSEQYPAEETPASDE